MYKMLVRPLLFLVDAEKIHHVVFKLLKIIGAIPGGKFLLSILYNYKNPNLSKTLFGLYFENPVGLAAGFDKNAILIDELACLGFGFIEIGTLTPKPQPGNPKPRLFRLPADGGLINRMGFNNEGVGIAVEKLKKRKSNVIVGGNIGKNKDTPNELAIDDYTYAFEVLFEHVDYFVVNVSSPNTPGLRALQEKEPLTHLLSYIKKLSLSRKNPKPVLLKIAPDLNEEQLNDIVEILQSTKTDGIIATNTTISRKELQTSAKEISEIGAGGLSGAPLKDQSNAIIKYLRNRLGPKYPIIGVGGIMNADDAIEKLNAGADLVQVYTGFVYEGPGFAKTINKKLAQRIS
jgi:dihydroorotate dehydrogenase